jgi:GNAT superfamily N-acetyltransferase
VAARVRLAWPDDLDALAALVVKANATYREWAGSRWNPPGLVHERSRWQARLKDGAAWNAVAEAGDEIVGCVSFTDARTEEGRGDDIPGLAHLSRMFVLPERWGHGIGGRLLTRGVDEMRRRGYEEAQLFTPVENARARGFYEHHGWRVGSATRPWQGLMLIQYHLSLADRYQP